MPIDSITKDELKDLLREVVTEAVMQHPLTEDEIKWVRLAIQAEVDRAAFRKAVIEKTFIGLLSAAVLGFATYAVTFFRDHWKM